METDKMTFCGSSDRDKGLKVEILPEIVPLCPNNPVILTTAEDVISDPGQNSQNHPVENVFIKYLKRKTGNLSSRQATILLLFAIVDLLAATVISIQAPFYPEVASDKGATATEFGAVFGIFELTAIIASPIFGSKMSSLGPYRVFIFGTILTGLSSMIFGTLHAIESRWTFISSCLFLRVFEAIGESAYVTASFTIIAKEFPQAVATTFAILETCYGCGMILGPTIGGMLYELGGYSLPFLTMGGLLCSSAFITCLIFPKSISSKPKVIKAPAPTEVGSIVVRGSVRDTFSLINAPLMAVTAFGIVATATGVGFLCGFLELHLRQFNLSKISVGFVFVLSGGTYACSAPFFGYLSDHKVKPRSVAILGLIFAIIGFVFIGPLPFIPYDTTLWTTCLGLVMFGFGMGASYVAGFVIFLNDAIARNYPDNISTYGLISGLWTCMVSLGYFIGPTFGGLLEDIVGDFRWTSLFVLGLQSIALILMLSVKPTRKISQTG